MTRDPGLNTQVWGLEGRMNAKVLQFAMLKWPSQYETMRQAATSWTDYHFALAKTSSRL